MKNFFRPYCPCKLINEDLSNACVVCGKPYDIDDEYNGTNPMFCSCAPTVRHTCDICGICGKTLREYAFIPPDDPSNNYCFCVTITRTIQDNKCEVCEKPKPADKATIFCCCYEPTLTNQEQKCMVCGKPKYFRMDNIDNCCTCQQKTRTDRDENCVVCGRPKCSDDTIKYCYNKSNCKYANPNRFISLVANRVYCPLQNIQWCPWIGAIEEIAQHCRTNHPRNFFEDTPTIECSAHLREYADLEYHTSEFIVRAYERLFKCSFEINSKGIMKWSTVVLRRTFDDEFNETFRFYVEFVNKKNEQMHLDAFCVKESVPTFTDFVTTAKMLKSHLRPFYDDLNNIQYRFLIVYLPFTLPEDNVVCPDFSTIFNERSNVPWANPTHPEPTVYEDNCRCVKTYVDRP